MATSHSRNVTSASVCTDTGRCVLYRAKLRFDHDSDMIEEHCSTKRQTHMVIILDRSQNYAFFRINLHYISFALHLHFICISHSPQN